MAKRNTDTKDKIKEAFIELINDKGFEALTVTDIARACNINRGTFYLHYVDKYELMEKLEMEIIYDLKQIILMDGNLREQKDPFELIPYETVLQALKYVEADFDFIQALASDNGDPQFMPMVKNILNELIMVKLSTQENLEFKRQALPEDYAREILLSSVVGIFNLWIKKGGQESPEQIAAIVTKAKQMSPYDLLL